MSANTSPEREPTQAWPWLTKELELWKRWRASLGGYFGPHNGGVFYEAREFHAPPVVPSNALGDFESRMIDMDRAIAQLMHTQPLLCRVFEAEHLRAWPLTLRVQFARCPERTYWSRLNLCYRWITDTLHSRRQQGVPK